MQVSSLPSPVHVPNLLDASGPDLPPCASCGTTRVGAYCHTCGQSVRQEGRLTMRGFASSFVHFVTNFDHGLPHTLAMLFRSPGDLARRYVTGDRQHFTHPLTVLLLSAVMVLLTFPLYEGAYRDLLAESLRASAAEQSPEDREVLQRLMGTPDQMADKTVALVKANTKVLAFVNAFPLAVALAVLLRRRYTLAEWLVATMYLVGAYNLVTSLLNPLLMLGLPVLGVRPNPTVLSFVNLGLLAVASGWMATRFYRPGVRTAALGVLANVLAGAFMFLVLAIAGIVVGIVMSVREAV